MDIQDKPVKMTDEEADQIMSVMAKQGEPDYEQIAVDAINSFTRSKMKEDGFTRKVFQPIAIK